MRLQSKLTLTIAAASLIPLLAATLVGRELVQRASRAEFDRLLRDGETEVQARFAGLQQELGQVIERLADPEDQFIGPILLSLADGGLDDEIFRQLAQVTRRVMAERGLDVLAVFDAKGVILASGHFPGRMGDHDPRRAQLLAWAHSGAAALQEERLLEGDQPVTRLTLQSCRQARSPLGTQVLVMAGRVLGPALMERLRLRGGTEARLEDSAGALLAGPRGWLRYARFPQRVVPLLDAAGQQQARVVLAVPDLRLRSTLRAINIAAGSLAGSGLLLALVVGALAGRRTSRRLQELVRGAGGVASGDLDQQLPVRGRDEIAELVTAFNRMTVDLKQSKEKLVAAERIAAWQEIARRIAHEVKNPLSPIQTSMETLRKAYRKQHPAFEEIFDESTTMILEEVQRLKTIVSEFSQFARLPKPLLAPCDLREVLPTVLALYGGEGFSVVNQLPEDLPPVLADREQLIQVFSNLVTNTKEALAGQSDGTLTVAATVLPGEVEVSLCDNGPGFAKTEAAKLFTPYFTTKRAAGGTGLGLAIVHRIVTDHGGRIEARSEPGRGASFTVCLPRA